jgi:hypothetical protein
MTRVTLGKRHRKIESGNIGQKTQKDKHGQHWAQDTENVPRVYLSVSCAQCYPCLYFCALCPILPVSIFLCLVPDVAHVYFYVSCAQCCPCPSFCILCQMLPIYG